MGGLPQFAGMPERRPKTCCRLQSPSPGRRVPAFFLPVMSTLEELAERIDRLLQRHDALQRTVAGLEARLASVSDERDSLRSRLNAARSRIDALLERLPGEGAAASAASPISDTARR